VGVVSSLLKSITSRPNAVPPKRGLKSAARRWIRVSGSRPSWLIMPLRSSKGAGRRTFSTRRSMTHKLLWIWDYRCFDYAHRGFDSPQLAAQRAIPRPLRVRDSRMLLSGIQARPELDPRLKHSGVTPLG
jgi:hypothetical protein